jgi:acetolactate synthase-1/3 small subunit
MRQYLVAYVEDRPGVLNRVASLFRRRAFNIDSLTVRESERPGLSRMTLAVDTDAVGGLRAEANLHKLLPVVEVQRLDGQPSVVRELALIKVAADVNTRGEILKLAEVFRVRVVDVAEDSLILEATGSEDKVDRLLTVLRPFGLLELGRSGFVAMARGGALQELTLPLAATGTEDALPMSV